MTPKQKVEALLRKTVAAGCPVGEVIAANELAVRLAIKYRIPSNELTWPALPTGYRWDGQSIVAVVAAPKSQSPHERHQARNAQAHAHSAAFAATPPPTPRAARTAPPPPRSPGAASKGWQPPKAGSMADIAWGLIKQHGGASAQAIASATGWQIHTVRGWVSIENKKRKASGLPPIQSTRVPNGPLYYI